MTDLEFIEKEIATTKSKYKEHIKYNQTSFAIKDEKKLKILQQIKTELEEYQKLKDKETPKTLVRYNHSNEWHCPTCGSGNGEYEGTVGTHNYCHYCGQKLNWR